MANQNWRAKASQFAGAPVDWSLLDLPNCDFPDLGAIGPALETELGYCTPVRSVQIVERRKGGKHAFAVVVLWPYRHVDLRYPPLRCASLGQARSVAMARAIQASGAATIERGARPPSIDMASVGDLVCMEALA